MRPVDWSEERPWVAWMGVTTFATREDLMQCPEELLEAALQACRSDSVEDRFGASELVFEHGKARIESGDWCGGLWLKRLTELRLRSEGIVGVNEIAAYLHPRLHAAVAQKLADIDRLPAELQSAPLNVIQELIETIDGDSAEALPSLLIATQLRLKQLTVPDNEEAAIGLAIREANMYANVGYTRDAVESANFAVGAILRNEFADEVIGQVAGSLIATSRLCIDRGDVDAAAALLNGARAVCRESHELYFDATFMLAGLRMETGDIREVYRLTEDANRAEVAKDDAEKHLISVLLGILRVELTGDFRQLATDASVVSTELGGPPNAMALFKSHLVKMMKGESLSDEELLEAANQLVECAHHSLAMDGSPFTAFAAALKCLASMKSFNDHVAFTDRLLTEAEAHIRSDSDEERQEFESLKRIVARKRAAALPPLAVNPPSRSSTTFKRTSTLRTVLLEYAMQVVDEDGRADLSQLLAWTKSARELARESYRNALTTEGSLPYRSEFDAIVRSLTLLTIGHLGCDRETLVSLYRGDPLAAYCCEVKPNHTDTWKLVSRLCAFYVAVSDWLAGGYEVRQMHQTLCQLEEEERSIFATERARLAESLSSSAGDPFVAGELADWEGEIPDIVSKLQVLRGLVQAGTARQPEMTVDEPIDTLPDDTCFCVIAPLFPAGCEGENVLVLIGFEIHKVHAWIRLSRSSLWCRAAKLIASQDLGGNEPIYSEIDEIVQNSGDAAGLCFEGLSDSIETINIVDLSSKNVPLSLLEDDNGRFAFTMSGPKSRQCTRTGIPRVSFWGLVANGDGNTDWINEQSRTIECESDAGHVTLRYPDIPDPHALLFGRENPPLVLGHFERWDFDDHQRAGRCGLEARVGRAATRSAFLQYPWDQVDVLHLSTHARAIAGTPEFAHIDMFPEESGVDVLHSFDVLSLDFSHLQLIFLSACQTKLGSQWTGNEDLSLAWAFRAAGAAAVIGMRWEVSDVAAWYFSHCFYKAWLGERKASIRESFRLAQCAVRQHPYFSKPSLWGAFVLLD